MTITYDKTNQLLDLDAAILPNYSPPPWVSHKGASRAAASRQSSSASVLVARLILARAFSGPRGGYLVLVELHQVVRGGN